MGGRLVVCGAGASVRWGLSAGRWRRVGGRRCGGAGISCGEQSRGMYYEDGFRMLGGAMVGCGLGSTSGCE